MSLPLLFRGLSTPTADGDTTLQGLVVNGAGHLEFAGTGTLTGRFVTPNPIPMRGRSDYLEPREMYVSWHVTAVQIPPYDTSTSGLTPREAPGYQRMTDQGLAWTIPTDPEGLTIEREMRVNIGGTAAGWRPWTRYRGGPLKASAVQFRVTVTRPDTSWQVEILNATCIVRLREPSLFDTTPEQSFGDFLLFRSIGKR